MMAARESWLEWWQVVWPRPLTPEAAVWLLRQLASAASCCPVVFETWGQAGAVRYLVGVERGQAGKLAGFMVANLPEVVVLPLPEAGYVRQVGSAAVVRLVDNAQPLDTRAALAVARSVLAVLAAAGSGEGLAVQVVLGRGLGPRPDSRAGSASWGQLLRQAATGQPPAAPDSALVAAARAKATQFGFAGVVRVGVTASSSGRREQLALDLLGALRSAATFGTGLTWRRCSPQRLERPFGRSGLDWVWPSRWQSRLSVDEVGPLLGLPLQTGGDTADLPGLPPLRPKRLPLPAVLTGKDRDQPQARVFAVSTAPATLGQPVGLSPVDGLTHLSVVAPTGTGKSTLLHHLVKGAVEAGGRVVLLDPKGDLVEAVLATIPSGREADVVVLDPTDVDRPVGFNPLRVRFGGSAELVADAVTGTIAGLWLDTGVRTLDVLSAAISTLTRLNAGLVAAGQPNQATLLDVPRLLSDQAFRTRMVGRVNDEVLAGFWAAFEADSVRQRSEVIAPVMRRLRQFLSRQALRAVLGQAEPRFDLAEAFNGESAARVVLVPLNKAQLGAGTAQLFGALVVAGLWNLTLGRAALPPNRRPPLSVVLDEAPDLLRLPLPLGDALAQARGLGVGFTLAAQFRSQWPPALRDAVDANTLSKVCFRQPASDARAMAAITGGQVEPEDLMALGQYEIYASLAKSGHASDWFSARTLPPPKAVSRPASIRQASRQSFGQAPDQPKPVAPTSQSGTTAKDGLGRVRRTP